MCSGSHYILLGFKHTDISIFVLNYKYNPGKDETSEECYKNYTDTHIPKHLS